MAVSAGRRGGVRGAWVVGGLAALLSLAGCGSGDRAAFAEGAASGGAAVADSAPGNGQADHLAYAHSVSVSLPAADMRARVEAAQAACADARFGQCVVLGVRQQGGDWPSAGISVRIVPAGVEPMIALASADAQLGSRSTTAEDLAVVVRDNTLAQTRLRRERERLQEFQARRDLAVADMIALSRQLAEIEAQLELAEQEGAQHRRRIDTQLLTIDFRPTSSHESRSEIVVALREFGANLAAGVAWTIRALAFLLPVALVLAVAVGLWRRWRRRATRKA